MYVEDTKRMYIILEDKIVFSINCLKKTGIYSELVDLFLLWSSVSVPVPVQKYFYVPFYFSNRDELLKSRVKDDFELIQ